MTPRKIILIRILLFVARIVNDDPEWAEALKGLETHINVNRWKESV